MMECVSIAKVSWSGG